MSPPAAACLSRRAARSPRASSARAPSASRWAQGFDAMTVPKVALAPHGMTDTAAPRLPHPYLLFLGDTTEPSFAKTAFGLADWARSEEHTSELQSLMRTSYAVFCLKKKKTKKKQL